MSEKENYPYGMKQKGDKWVLIPTSLELEMSKVLKVKIPELSEDAAVILAHDFLSDSYNYDYFYHRKREGENACMEAFNLKSSYGAEPFIFDENSKPVSINEPVFSQWIDDVLKNMRYRLILPYEYANELADSTLTVERVKFGKIYGQTFLNVEDEVPIAPKEYMEIAKKCNKGVITTIEQNVSDLF